MIDINLSMVYNKYTIINPNTLSLQLQFIGLIGMNQYEPTFAIGFTKLSIFIIIVWIYILYCL